MSLAAPRHRLAVVLSHPTQYYSPWFRWLRAHTALTFRVFYLWDFGVTRQRDPGFGTSIKWDVDLLDGYDSEFVPNTAPDPGTHHFQGLRNPELPSRLAAWRPDAVLTFGYNWASHLRAIFWARCRGVPLLFRGDSHFLGRNHIGVIRRTILRVLYAQFAGFLPVGIANHEYFTALHVPPRKLFFSPHSVNDAFFEPSRVEYRQTAAALREQLQIPAAWRVVLFAGKLVNEKGPRELLEAFLGLSPPNAALVFVGDGPEKPTLAEIARSDPTASVHFLPFANQSEMPARYLLGDIFTLPSRGLYETWGLAVNEAMHMGLPALVSNRVGCQRDLVTPGQTGWVFSVDDPADLSRQLKLALQADIARMKPAIAARIGRYTYPETTRGLFAALAAIALSRS